MNPSAAALTNALAMPLTFAAKSLIFKEENRLASPRG